MTTLMHEHHQMQHHRQQQQQQQQEHGQDRLPPSPPLSPPRRRHRKTNSKKQTDPFLELANTPLPSPSPPASPQPGEPGVPVDDDESAIKRILLTPLLFTSFLVSLFLINRSDRARRQRSQPSSASSPSSTSSSPWPLLSYLYPSSWWKAVANMDPEPYQDPQVTTWDRRGAAAGQHVEPHDAIAPKNGNGRGASDPPPPPPLQGQKKRKQRSWHLHRKIRKVARLEVSDALEMRDRVMAVMVAFAVAVVGVLLWASSVLWAWLRDAR